MYGIDVRSLHFPSDAHSPPSNSFSDGSLLSFHRTLLISGSIPIPSVSEQQLHETDSLNPGIYSIVVII